MSDISQKPTVSSVVREAIPDFKAVIRDPAQVHFAINYAAELLAHNIEPGSLATLGDLTLKAVDLTPDRQAPLL